MTQRQPETVTCANCGHPTPIQVPDPFCFDCGTWHHRNEHLMPSENKRVEGWSEVPRAVRTPLLRDIEARLRNLPTRHFNNHTGDWVERAAVMNLLDPRKVAA